MSVLCQLSGDCSLMCPTECLLPRHASGGWWDSTAALPSPSCLSSYSPPFSPHFLSLPTAPPLLCAAPSAVFGTSECGSWSIDPPSIGSQHSAKQWGSSGHVNLTAPHNQHSTHTHRVSTPSHYLIRRSLLRCGCSMLTARRALRKHAAGVWVRVYSRRISVRRASHCHLTPHLTERCSHCCVCTGLLACAEQSISRIEPKCVVHTSAREERTATTGEPYMDDTRQAFDPLCSSH